MLINWRYRNNPKNKDYIDILYRELTNSKNLLINRIIALLSKVKNYPKKSILTN